MKFFKEEANSLLNFQQGKVRLAVSQQLAASVIPYLMTAFQHEYPYIYTSLTDTPVEQVLKHVQNLDVDLGIGPERSGLIDVESEELFTLGFHVVFPPSHRFAQYPNICWQDLEEETLIVLSGEFSVILGATLPSKIANRILNAQYQVNFMSTALSMVNSGLGITLCMPYVRRWVKQNNLLMQPIKEPVVMRQFNLYRRAKRPLSPAADAFCNFLKRDGIIQTFF
ncbi:LysR substrate-binding domain-containing protein [Rodentibacter myodis]|uniref:LysR substrate-binding domain-containing protein n=1 Tax=Rodentibacter myodis TaxID=1907939 RepID=UPI001ABFE81A|nr:LysR substrate-binding domain-containing protein [Rodentibacter myodis]